MGLITKGKSWVDNENVTYTDLNGDFDTLYNEVNGSLDNANIKAGAGIEPSKISGTAITISNPQTFLGKKTFAATVQTITTATDGSTVTFDLSLGNIHQVTMGGDRTLALTNVSVGQCFVVRLIQDGTGTRIPTWFSTIKWPSGVTPTLTTTAGKIDVFGFICTSAGNYDGFIVGQSL